MGIRFFCSNGHRLNVKEYLAGKTGFCPDCGERVTIPLQSDPAALKSRKRKPDDRAAEYHDVDKDDADGDLRLGEVGVPQEGGSIVLSSSVGASPPTPPALGGFMAIAPSSSGPAIQFSMPAATSGAAAAEDAAAASSPPPAPATSGAASPSGPGGDPLSAVPTATWYVRPPVGGQFGPATNDIMREWVAEGRVVAQALVWRDGWPQWQSAADVFPNLRKPAPPSASPPPSLIGLLEDQPSIATTPAAIPVAHRLPAPYKKKNYLNIVITILLSILVVLLAILLVVVLRGRQNPEEPETTTALLLRHSQARAVGQGVVKL